MANIEGAHVSGNVISQPAVTVDIITKDPEIGAVAMGGSLGPSDAYKDLNIASNPIAYWRLGDVGPTIAVEEIGAINGTAVNSPTFGTSGLVVGGSNKAVTFNATSNINAPFSSGVFNFNDSVNDLPFSIKALVKIPSVLAVPNPIISKTGISTATANEYLFEIFDGFIILELYTGTITNRHKTITNIKHITNNNVFHLVVTYNAAINTALIYVNGVSVAVTYSETGTYTHMNDVPSNLFIGSKFLSDANEGHFQGVIDEPIMYNRVLTPAEILTDYNASI